MIYIFWILFVLIFFTYIGYPLFLFLITFFKHNDIRKQEIYPNVSIIISAYNEEQNIGKKLEDTLNLEYPSDKLEIIVASDGSTDNTNNIVKEIQQKNKNIKLIEFKERKGKTFVQNEAVKIAKGEIIIFSDATTIYEKDVIKKLVRNFYDERVGAVGGELIYISKGSVVGKGNSLYWKYEKFLKKKESQLTSLIGVSGCCYAVRKELYEPINPELISDFVIAQIIYKKGKKVVYEQEAISYEETNKEPQQEFNMRVRVGVRTLNGLWYMKELLNPFKYGLFSFQLIFHKIFRYSVPIFLVLLFITNFFLVITKQGIIYNIFFILQILFYLLAVLKISIPYYFCITNLALLVSIYLFLKGEKKVLWSPIRNN